MTRPDIVFLKRTKMTSMIESKYYDIVNQVKMNLKKSQKVSFALNV